ncbi:carbohydrate-binding module family 48 protein, partial [Mycena rebaudengoi]
MGDLHEVEFKWPSTDPSVVIVTGTFDQWSSSVHLVKGDTGFRGTVRIPWNDKIAFKYIVDSVWLCGVDFPTETDASGNQNNVYTAPPKP